MKESHRVVLLPLETGAAEGGALVCFREVGGLYAAIYEVTIGPFFFSLWTKPHVIWPCASE